MAAEPCSQCGTQLQAGQLVCSNCGFRRPPPGAQFRTGTTGVHAAPTPPASAAPPSPAPSPPPSPPGPVAPPGPPAWPAAPGGASGWPGAPPGATPPQGQAAAWGAGPGAAGWGTAPRAGLALSIAGLVGAGLVAIGSFLPWFGEKVLGLGGQALNAFDLPIGLLIDVNAGDSGFTIGIPLVVLAAAGAGLSLAPKLAVWRRLAGVLVMLVTAGWMVTGVRGLLEADNLSVDTLFRVWGIGTLLALVGGILLVAGRGSRSR